MIPPSLIANLSVGAIVGLTKDNKNDSHFIFKSWETKLDSLDPNRPSAKKYMERSYRILSWKTIKKRGEF